MSVHLVKNALQKPNNQNPDPRFDESIQQSQDPEKPSVKIARQYRDRYLKQHTAVQQEIKNTMAGVKNRNELALEIAPDNVAAEINSYQQHVKTLYAIIQKEEGYVWNAECNGWVKQNPPTQDKAYLAELKRDYAYLSNEFNKLIKTQEFLNRNHGYVDTMNGLIKQDKELYNTLERAEQQLMSVECAEKIDKKFHGGIDKHPKHKGAVLTKYQTLIEDPSGNMPYFGAPILLTKTVGSGYAQERDYRLDIDPQTGPEIQLTVRHYNYNGDNANGKPPTYTENFIIDEFTCQATQIHTPPPSTPKQ